MHSAWRRPIATGDHDIGDKDTPIDAASVNAGRYEIEVAGERIPATVSLKPFYDSSGSG
jgi:hypothetical protein